MKSCAGLARVFLLIALLLAHLPAFASGEEDKKGVWVERRDGSFLRLEVEEGKFQLHFYDRERKTVAPDAPRAVVHYTPPLRSREMVPLMPAETGAHLEAPQVVRPPYNFNISLVLLFDDKARQNETYTFEFRPEHAGAPGD